MPGMELDRRNQLGMGREGVERLLFPKVPQADGIISTSCGNVVAGGREGTVQDLLRVAAQVHDPSAGAQVPHHSLAAQVARGY